MKLAVTVWNQRIAPVFDSAGLVLVFSKEEGGALKQRQLSLRGKDLVERASLLRENEVDELVCGAISWEAEALVREEGILVYPFIAGDLEEVIQAWKKKCLYSEEFSMPGCGFARRRRRHRNGNRYGMSSNYPQV